VLSTVEIAPNNYVTEISVGYIGHAKHTNALDRNAWVLAVLGDFLEAIQSPEQRGMT